MQRPGAPVVPQPAAGAGGFDGSEPHRGVRAPGCVTEDRTGDAVEAGERVQHSRRVGPPGMGGVHGHALPSPPLLEAGEELDLRALAAGVRGGRGVVPGEVVGVVGAELLGVHATRGHQHDPALPRRRELGPQQVGHQHRTQHVHRHAELVALRGRGARGRHHPGVVDEHVHPLLGELGDEAAHVVEVADVAAAHVDPRAGDRPAQLLGGALALGLVADHQHDLRAAPREPLGGGGAETGRRTGDERDAARQCVGLGVRRPPGQVPAHGQADGGVAGRDGPVHRHVDDPSQRAGHQREVHGITLGMPTHVDTAWTGQTAMV